MQLTGPQLSAEDLQRAGGTISHLQQALSTKIVGQAVLQESLLIGLIASGHVLLESVPGLAKTTAAKTLADSLAARFQRIQCTPDLLPSDITGGQIWDQKTGEFKVSFGPVHANVVLLDEINRSSAKTQSAMLEAMEERQTTIAGTVYPIPEPFLVVATQNPVDQEGTYPLSEAQTDRFMLKDVVAYPSVAEEVEMIHRMDAGLFDKDRRRGPVVGLDDIRTLQRVVRGVQMDAALMRYASELVSVSRDPQVYLEPRLARLVSYGASPRATIAFCRAARALAVLSGRGHVIPDDIAKLAHRILRHRLILSFEATASGVTADTVIDAILHAVRVP